MAKTHTRAYAFLLPVLFVGTLQLSGCLRRELPPPPPGGMYQSTSAGAQFEQAVALVGEEGGEVIGNIAELSIRQIHRVREEASTIYVTAGGQGVFRTRDEGATWQQVNQPLSAVTGLVQLRSGILLIGGTNTDGEGVVERSLTGGDSWERVLTIPALHRRQRQLFEVIKPPPPPSVFVSSIVLDPFNDERIYATTSTGEVLVGEESGKVWSTLSRIQSDKRDPLTNRSIASIRDVIPSPHQAGELLLITTDGNMVLIRDSEIAAVELPKGAGNIVDVVFIEQFPGALFVGTDRGALFSRDRGTSWEEFDLPISTTSPVRNSVVRASPSNPSRLLIAIDSIIYRSEDGGQTFNTLSLNLPNHIITDIAINPTNAAKVLLSTSPVSS